MDGLQAGMCRRMEDARASAHSICHPNVDVCLPVPRPACSAARRSQPK
ncbi:hypothetical protein ACO22_05802 [Paracoccidioides brasiliensis]|uniref:Uncharacterized protein n=1 Tax=Paracoccidioides brasiliensis TaxID=121759 RepID=A0A1D2J999_PARBR|nr:hypothetical protein ACO22_05802 [Paracoccidioides brasiliensis]